ncbi:porin [Microbaculum marinum]|uniref:Porin n=1 Tax=Microbaculum marinum TaxID=1764581 RepID=A0AAW9RY97_9HYPH
MHAVVSRGGRSGGLAGCSVAIAMSFAAPGHAADMAFGSTAGGAPVHRCDLDGFIELPSTDICFKIGGHARLVSGAIDKNWTGDDNYYIYNIAVDGYRAGSSGTLPNLIAGFQTQTFQTYGQGRVNFDARTRTEYGTVRAFVEAQADDDESRTGGGLDLRHAFVQFGNWTFGKTWSTFVDRDARIRRADPYKVVGDPSGSMRRSQVRFTQDFGGGISLALAAEDQEYNSPDAAIVGLGPYAPIAIPAATALSVVNDSSGMPDFVAALKWEREGVGSAQISGAVHQNKFAEQQTIGGVPVQSFSDDQFGFAALFGLALNVPTGAKDKFTFIAMYADGASNYQQDLFGTNTDVVWGRCGAVNCIVDNVTKASVNSSYTHYWTKTVSTTIGAGYGKTGYGATGTATAGVLGAPGVLNVSSFEGVANIQWEPVTNTTLLLDVHYGHVDYNGFDVNPVQPGIQDSQGAWTAILQFTREF